MVDYVFEKVFIYKHGKIALITRQRNSSLPCGSRESILYHYSFLDFSLPKIELESFCLLVDYIIGKDHYTHSIENVSLSLRIHLGVVGILTEKVVE